MTAKQKAGELIDKFIPFSLHCYSSEVAEDYRKINNIPADEKIKFHNVTTYSSTYYAKQCALIAVDNIIASNPHSNPLNTELHSTMQYWMEVKKEIEKL